MDTPLNMLIVSLHLSVLSVVAFDCITGSRNHDESHGNSNSAQLY